ncbi:MAG: polysaccharide pyruvyl transferase family protein [Solirubrobacteraceae bacterium]
MRVELVNTVALNGGDAAILLAIRAQLERALGDDLTLVARDPEPQAAGMRYPEVAFATPAAAAIRPRSIRYAGRAQRELDLLRWRAAARALRVAPELTRALLRAGERGALAGYASAELGVSTGGTYLVERYGIWRKVFEIDLLRALGIPVVLYTQSLGPFARRSNRRAMRRIAGRADLVLLRDEVSRLHLLELGVAPDRLHVVADAVFTFARDAPRDPPPSPRRIVVSVREWPFTGNAANYAEAVGRLVCHLVRRCGAEVTFLSTCQGVREYWTDDAREAHRIAAALPGDVRDAVTVDGDFHRPEALLDILAGFDLAVSTRMHHAILSLCAGTPVLPVAYEFKTRELFERLGLGAVVTDIDALGSDGLVDAFERFWGQREEWRRTLPAAVAREHRLADQAAALVGELLADTTRRRALAVRAASRKNP